MDWDEHGEPFFINTVIGHLWHAVPGAHFERMYGEDFNPYLFQLMEQAADHVHWSSEEKWGDVKKGISFFLADLGMVSKLLSDWIFYCSC